MNKKIIEFVKKHVILCGIIIIFIIPVIILTVFNIPCPIKFYENTYEPDDILAYYGSILTFIGTIIIGWVVYQQTEKNNLRKELEDNTVALYYEPNSRIEVYDENRTQHLKITIIADKQFNKIHTDSQIKVLKNKATIVDCVSQQTDVTEKNAVVIFYNKIYGEDIISVSDENVGFFLFLNVERNKCVTPINIGIWGKIEKYGEKYHIVDVTSFSHTIGKTKKIK